MAYYLSYSGLSLLECKTEPKDLAHASKAAVAPVKFSASWPSLKLCDLRMDH